jgi:hypothetical protein
LSARFAEPWVGADFDLRIILSIYQGFPFRVWVMGTWRFGSDGRLKKIIIEKQTDGL